MYFPRILCSVKCTTFVFFLFVVHIDTYYIDTHYIDIIFCVKYEQKYPNIRLILDFVNMVVPSKCSTSTPSLSDPIVCIIMMSLLVDPCRLVN